MNSIPKPIFQKLIEPVSGRYSVASLPCVQYNPAESLLQRILITSNLIQKDTEF
jgi:hypothetical protein